jgi:phosphoesterase RecJ-like protein
MNNPRHIDSSLGDALASNDNILCVSHVDPDGDAVGSLLGIGWILRRMGKEPVLALQDAVPIEHRVLPGASSIITSESTDYEMAIRQRKFDLVVCVDASSPDRMGTTYNLDVHGDATLVVIDHHVTNTYFGDINWVDPSCSSTCQMLVYLADALHVSLEGELAECLLTGMVTDTLGFRTSNTTADVLGAAMRLMENGADLATITQRTVNRRPYNVIKLWAQVLPHVQMQDGVIWTSVSLDDIARSGSAEQVSSSRLMRLTLAPYLLRGGAVARNQ